MSKSSLESVKVLVKEGWLLKRGEYIKNWRSRYMMLYSTGILYGFKCNPAESATSQAQEPEEPLNEFDLRHCSVKPSDKPSKSGFPFTIGFIQGYFLNYCHFSPIFVSLIGKNAVLTTLLKHPRSKSNNFSPLKLRKKC